MQKFQGVEETVLVYANNRVFLPAQDALPVAEIVAVHAIKTVQTDALEDAEAVLEDAVEIVLIPAEVDVRHRQEHKKGDDKNGVHK